jgi:hypothetical protein
MIRTMEHTVIFASPLAIAALFWMIYWAVACRSYPWPQFAHGKAGFGLVVLTVYLILVCVYLLTTFFQLIERLST